ncbi:hypothetical protein NDU88_004297 [Pleurodeles waltl]|uniref:Uncharacterized protein n=1 Tax=Pleurodeles waltl TaxID=8319 RepID=A0AAV7KZZ7_PLEWA|nr:hypothetical protein NDU88_004297 [Pleurodeles waltl]
MEAETELQRKVMSVRERLERYTLKSYRQLLHRKGDISGRLLASILCREIPRPIVRLKTPTGADAYTQTAIVDILQTHMKQVHSTPGERNPGRVVEFLESLALPQVGEQAAQDMDANITLEEDRHALTILPGEKTPGSDGFPPGFYRTYIADISQQLLEVYLEHNQQEYCPPQ